MSPRRAVPPTSAAPAPLDVHLVERARDGDAAAFRALYERFAPMVHGVLVAHASPRLCDDLMQEVFLAAWRGLARLRRDEHVGAWLATIARHAAWRAGRRAGRAPDSLDRLVADGHAPEPVDPRPAHDGSGEVLAVLATLPAAYRETLALRLVEGLTGPEIAEATGLTHGSVRVNLCRGLALLKAALHEKGWP